MARYSEYFVFVLKKLLCTNPADRISLTDLEKMLQPHIEAIDNHGEFILLTLVESHISEREEAEVRGTAIKSHTGGSYEIRSKLKQDTPPNLGRSPRPSDIISS